MLTLNSSTACTDAIKPQVPLPFTFDCACTATSHCVMLSVNC